MSSGKRTAQAKRRNAMIKDKYKFSGENDDNYQTVVPGLALEITSRLRAGVSAKYEGEGK